MRSSSRWNWALLALPGVAWLSVFFLVALYAVLAVAFGNQDTLSQPVPFWNPLDWNVGYVLEMLKNIWHGDQFLTGDPLLDLVGAAAHRQALRRPEALALLLRVGLLHHDAGHL